MKNSGPAKLLARMSSLGDETRLRLLHLVSRQELGVAELCEIVQLPQSTVSRHLKVLLDEGWVRSRRQGTTHLYQLVEGELDADGRKLWGLARDQTSAWSAVLQDEIRLERVLKERLSETQSFFAGAAGEWDRLRVEMYGSRFTRSALLALIPSHYVVADLGCGTGEITEELSRHVSKVIAVDNSSAMLRAARKRIGETEHVEWHRAEVESLPLEDGCCDAALLVLVLAYVEEPANVVKEMGRILKSGGKGIVVDLLPHDREDFRRGMQQRWLGFSPEEVRQWMVEGGFGEASVKIKALEGERAVKGPGLFLAVGDKK